MHAHWTIVGLTLGSLQAPLCLNCLVSIRNICSSVDQRCWLTPHTRNRQYSHYVVLHRLDSMFYHPNRAIEKPHQMAAGGGRVKSLHEFHTHTHTHTHLVVSPSLPTSCAPSARTAIRNWYRLMEASIATLRPARKLNTGYNMHWRGPTNPTIWGHYW